MPQRGGPFRFKPPLRMGPFDYNVKVVYDAVSQLRATFQDVVVISTGDPASQLIRATFQDVTVISTGDPTSQNARVTFQDVVVIHSGNPALQNVRLTRQYLEVPSSGNPALQNVRLTQQYLEVVSPFPYNQPTPIVSTRGFHPPFMKRGPWFFRKPIELNTPSMGLAGFLTAPFVDDSANDTFYAPTVTNTNALAPGLVDDSANDTFYAPTVLATYPLIAALFDDSVNDTFYGPTVQLQAGDITLHPGLITDTDAFYGPTVTATYQLLPGLVVDADTFFTTLLSIQQFLAAGLYVDPDTFYSPTVGNVISLQPGLVTDTDQFFAPVLARILSPGLFIDADVLYATILKYNITLRPPFVTDADNIYIPAVQYQKQHGGGGSGGGGGNIPADIKYASSITMTESGLITAIGINSEVAKTLNIRLGIYDNTAAGGLPNNLVAKTNDHGSVVLGNNIFSLQTPYAVSNGQTVWVAMQTDAKTSWFLANNPNGSKFNNDLYADGLSNPFGPTSNDNKQAPLFVVYLTSATATVSPPLMTDDVDTFYAPTASTAFTLIPDLLTDSDIIWTPPVVATATPESVAFFQDQDQVFAPSISSTYNLSPGLVIDSDIIYDPAVLRAGLNLASAHFIDQDVIYAPIVTPLGAASGAPFVVDQDTVFAPAVTATFPMHPPLVTDTDVFYGPAITTSNVLRPGLVIDQDVINVFPPAMTQTGGPQSLGAPFFQDQDYFFPPEVKFQGLQTTVTLEGSGDVSHNLQSKLSGDFSAVEDGTGDISHDEQDLT